LRAAYAISSMMSVTDGNGANIMKATAKLLVAALAAAGLAVAAPAIAAGNHSGGGGHWGGGHSGGGHFNGGHFNGGHFNGGHFRGGHFHRGHFFGPRASFFFGAPIVVGSWWWGYPYPYYDYYPYPRDTVIYREVETYPQGEISGAQAAPGPGSPTQGPLYMNYCESAQAYYPKVGTCPEGWKFIAPPPQQAPAPQAPRY
jgi:hypothetical protein